MKRWLKITLIVLVTGLLLALPSIYGESRADFLGEPRIIFSTTWEEDDTLTFVVEAVFPPARHDVFGRVWKESQIRWDELEFTLGHGGRWERGKTWPHGMTGVVTVGQALHDVPDTATLWYLPDDEVVWRWSMSH